MRFKKPGLNVRRPGGLRYYRSTQPKTPISPFKPKGRRPSYSYFSRMVDLIIITLLIAVIIYSLVVKADATIVASSEVYHSKNEYKNASDKLLGSFKNRTKLSFNEAGLIDQIRRQFPEVAAGKVELPLFSQKPVIHLSIGEPKFNLSSSSGSYIVNNQGVVVVKSGTLPALKNLVAIDDRSGFEISEGRQVLSAGSVAFIDTIISQCQRARVTIKSLTLPALAQQLDLRTADRSYYVKFYLGGNAAIQAGQFLAARADFDKRNDQPNEYLDVRVPGKIFYK